MAALNENNTSGVNSSVNSANSASSANVSGSNSINSVNAGGVNSASAPANTSVWLVPICMVIALFLAVVLGGCSAPEEAKDETANLSVSDVSKESTSSANETSKESQSSSAEALRAQLDLTEDYRSSFVHGEKGAAYQKYIMLHDTEGETDAEAVIDYWDGNGSGVAAHFIVNKDGSIVQCVDMDTITHHAGFGDTGHNAEFDVTDESRDDKVGTTPIGSNFADYGMNSYSIGIEMVHVGGSGEYPEAQLEAVDALIAYIDAYYGAESQIVDHKAWRSGNSDTSAEFASYLANYQDHRTHA